jgi:hypothetical protein
MLSCREVGRERPRFNDHSNESRERSRRALGGEAKLFRADEPDITHALKWCVVVFRAPCAYKHFTRCLPYI